MRYGSGANNLNGDNLNNANRIKGDDEQATKLW
jgi:hypothetical protein